MFINVIWFLNVVSVIWIFRKLSRFMLFICRTFIRSKLVSKLSWALYTWTKYRIVTFQTVEYNFTFKVRLNKTYLYTQILPCCKSYVLVVISLRVIVPYNEVPTFYFSGDKIITTVFFTIKICITLRTNWLGCPCLY